MKMIMLIALAASATVVQASTFSYTFDDPYGGPDPGATRNNGDVIGELRRFDAEKVTISGNSSGVFQFSIFMNYGGGDTSLGSISVGSFFPLLNPGDVMISSGANNWALALVSHSNTDIGPGGLTGGNLYEVDNFLTARTVLGNPSGSYRPDEFVWGNSTGAVQIGGGTVITTALGGSKIKVDLNFTTTDAAFLHAMSTGDFALSFASATCANDIVVGQGGGSDVPEPMTTALIGAGLAGLGLLRRNKK